MLDHNGGFVLSAFGITLVVLVTYALYLRARLRALRAAPRPTEPDDYSGRNVSAAAPTPTTAQAASSANGPTAA